MSNLDDGQLIGAYPYLPKQERAQLKKNLLLESGHKLFMNNGYEHTTAKEIAYHAGVSTGTFYRYFSDKRQLLMSLLEDKLEKMIPPELNWVYTEPEQVLAQKLEKHFEELHKFGLYRILPELLLKDPELSRIIMDARKSWHNKILNGLQKAKERELLWDDLDLEMVVWSILVILENIPKKEMESGKRTNYLELARVICRLVFPPESIGLQH